MHLRYDPLAEVVMSGATNARDVPTRDLHIIRRYMREACRNWNGSRRYVIRLPEEMRLARHFDPRMMPFTRGVMRTAEVELVREPRRAPGPMTFAKRWAFNPIMRDMVNEKALAMQALRDYCVKDVEAVMAMEPKMPPLDAPKPAPRARVKSVTSDDFIERLKRRGYRTLGAGCFSTVLAKGKSDRVIKVNRRPDGWLDYVLWAAERGHMGKNAPMVYSFKRFNEGTDDEFYVAVVERCKNTVDDLYPQNKRVTELFSSLTSGMRGRVGSERDALKADDMQPGSLRFAIEFRLEFNGGGLDLHSGNFMVREDGSLVCTDPISGDAKGTAPSRWRASSARLAA
jgi:hypothetical protein